MLNTSAPSQPFARSDMSLRASSMSGRVTYTTAPTFPILQINGTRYAFALVGGQYALNVYSQENAYVDGQYSLALYTDMALTEAMNFTSDQSATTAYGLALNETFNVTTTTTYILSLGLVLDENVALADTFGAGAKYVMLLTESVELRDLLVHDGATYAGYVVNANTGAVSLYEGWNFNSFAKIGNKYYGANADGIYELTGTSDGGVNIDAVARTPQLDFGSTYEKRLPKAYMGCRANGDIMLRTISEDGTQLDYLLTPYDYLAPHVFTLARGPKSRYWKVEILNVGGSDIGVDNLELMPVELARHRNTG